MSTAPTGFPRGRPRKGEIRPLTPGAAYQRTRRERLKAEDLEAFNATNAIYQKLWQLKNPGAKRKSQTAYLQREVHWQASRGKMHSVCL